MLDMLRKILATEKTVIPTGILFQDTDNTLLGEKTQLSQKIKRIFRGSLAIREVAAGSSNAEEQELTALTNSYYDIERFGVHFVASPRHADMLMVTGPVSRNMIEGVKHTYDAMPTPKIVVAVGDGAIHGSVFRGSYAICDSLREVIPVDYEIAGDPPSPTDIIRALNQILDFEEAKRTDKNEQKTTEQIV
jgi:Ni,Fe-hydrogenase III small subunit